MEPHILGQQEIVIGFRVIFKHESSAEDTRLCWASHTPDLNPLVFHFWDQCEAICHYPTVVPWDKRLSVERLLRQVPHEQCQAVIDYFYVVQKDTFHSVVFYIEHLIRYMTHEKISFVTRIWLYPIRIVIQDILCKLLLISFQWIMKYWDFIQLHKFGTLGTFLVSYYLFYD